MTWDLPRTHTSLSLDDNGRDGASPAVCTLPMVPRGSSPVARVYLAKNEAPEEEADLGLCCNQMLDACWQRFEPRNIDHPSLVANSTAKENGSTTSVVCTFFVYSHFNRLFPSFKIFHFQNEAKCKHFLVIMSPICMKIVLISVASHLASL